MWHRRDTERDGVTESWCLDCRLDTRSYQWRPASQRGHEGQGGGREGVWGIRGWGWGELGSGEGGEGKKGVGREGVGRSRGWREVGWGEGGLHRGWVGRV